jgi:thymidylate synthase ThyX
MSRKLNLIEKFIYWMYKQPIVNQRNSRSKVTILNSSYNKTSNSRIITFLIEGFPKILVGELAKHRLLSMSCQSSRAVPLGVIIKQVWYDPYLPIWTTNQKGMAGKLESSGIKIKFNNFWSIIFSRIAILFVLIGQYFFKTHKQNLNRYLEPWMKVSLIITGTEWDNFFELRTAAGTQDDLRSTAKEMQYQFLWSTPNQLNEGDWHKPYPNLTIYENVAKCASISYSNHNKKRTLTDSIRLFNKLKEEKHTVPFEHCAMCVDPGFYLGESNELEKELRVFDIFQPERSSLSWYLNEFDIVNTGNFKGFMPFRRFIEKGIDKNVK